MKKGKQKKEKKSGDIKEDKLDCVDVRLNLFFEFISFSFGCSYFFTFLPCIRALTTSFFFSLFPSALSEVIFLCCLL